jgi:myo-inositol-1(or 4)-monophosphatase
LNTPTLSFLESLASQAGEILRAGFGGDNQVYFKSEIDLVTDVDRKSEAFLIDQIHRHFPEHRIVAEESGRSNGRVRSTWYIDPLDGTVNFAHGMPGFAVAIGYEEEGVMRLGAVYDPIREECFSAERDRGAWLNGLPIRVSEASNLDQSLLVTGFAYDIRTNPRNNLDYFSYFMLHSQGVRRFGAAALDLCYVACGRLDGYWELFVNPWDLAGAGLVAEMAGASVTAISGGPDYITEPCSILATAPLIYPQMLEVFNKETVSSNR